MFERFTDRARRVVVLAQGEARLLDHNYIGTEHLLLGLLEEQEGVAATALVTLGVELDRVRSEVEAMIGRGQTAPVGHIPFTRKAKKVLELSLREALALGHNYIGTEHILLGLIREGEGVAAEVLTALGVDLDRVRQTVTQLLSGYGEETVAFSPPARIEMGPSFRGGLGFPGRSRSGGPRCPTCQRELLSSAAHRTIEVPSEDEGGEAATVRVIFCRNCGRTLGTTIAG